MTTIVSIIGHGIVWETSGTYSVKIDRSITPPPPLPNNQITGILPREINKEKRTFAVSLINRVSQWSVCIRNWSVNSKKEHNICCNLASSLLPQNHLKMTNTSSSTSASVSRRNDTNDVYDGTQGEGIALCSALTLTFILVTRLAAASFVKLSNARLVFPCTKTILWYGKPFQLLELFCQSNFLRIKNCWVSTSTGFML